MTTTSQCNSSVELKCPNCTATVSSRDLVPRYTGPERFFESKFMCPTCWKDKKVTLDSQMEKLCKC